jgi:hypothetical protein
MGKTRPILTLCTLLTLAASAQAQTVTVPHRLAVACPMITPDATQNLTDDHLSGNWKQFQKHAVAIVKAVSGNCQADDRRNITINANSDVVILLWVARPPLGGNPVVYRGLVQNPAGDPFNDILPGIDADRPAFELFLSTGPKDAIATAYTSVRARNPLEEQLPAFAEAVVNPLFAVMASTRQQIRMQIQPPPPPAAKPPTHFATISRVALPFARAAIHVDVKMAIAPTEDSIRKDIDDLHSHNALVTGAHTPCARGLNDKFKNLVVNKLKEVVVGKDRCADDLDTCTKELLLAFTLTYEGIVGSCGASELALKELLAVDASYRDYRRSAS